MVRRCSILMLFFNPKCKPHENIKYHEGRKGQKLKESWRNWYANGQSKDKISCDSATRNAWRQAERICILNNLLICWISAINLPICICWIQSQISCIIAKRAEFKYNCYYSKSTYQIQSTQNWEVKSFRF